MAHPCIIYLSTEHNPYQGFAPVTNGSLVFSRSSCGPNSSGLLGLVAERGVLEPEREEMEAAFLIVTTDEEVELVLDDFRRWGCPGPEEFIV